MESSKNENTLAGSVIRVGVAAFLWALLFATLYYVVPTEKRKIEDLGMPVPALTVTVIDIGMWFEAYWWLAAIPLMLLVPIAFAITWLVRQQTRSRMLAASWTFLLFAPPLVCHLFVWAGLWLMRTK
jgi:type II secretory pathway component PulF